MIWVFIHILTGTVFASAQFDNNAPSPLSPTYETPEPFNPGIYSATPGAPATPKTLVDYSKKQAKPSKSEKVVTKGKNTKAKLAKKDSKKDPKASKAASKKQSKKPSKAIASKKDGKADRKVSGKATSKSSLKSGKKKKGR